MTSAWQIIEVWNPCSTLTGIRVQRLPAPYAIGSPVLLGTSRRTARATLKIKLFSFLTGTIPRGLPRLPFGMSSTLSGVEVPKSSIREILRGLPRGVSFSRDGAQVMLLCEFLKQGT